MAFGPSLAGYSQGGQLPPDVWQQLSSMYTNPQMLQALREQMGGGSEYIDHATGLTFAPKFKEIAGQQIFDGGTIYNSQNPDQRTGSDAYTTAGSVYDANGKFAQPFTIDKKPSSFMDKYGFMIPLAAPFAASALGLGATAGAAGAGAAGATTAPVLGSTGAITGTELGTLGAAGATTAPVLGSTGALTGTELGTLGAAGTTGAVDLGGGLMMTADGAITGATGAFAPATAAEMAGMGVGAAGAGGTLQSLGSAASKLFSGSAPSWLGPAAAVAGGLLGAQGQQNSATSTRELPAYLRAPVTDMVNRTQGLVGDQMAPAYAAGAQMVGKGTGLLDAPVAGNGVGKVTLNAPNTPTNPYLSGLADDIQRRTQEMLWQNNLAIQGNSVAAGGLGGSRQGVAQGVAAGKAADYLSGNLAGLYGTAYNNDQNRALTQYGMDQGFYTGQRGQDLAQVGVGAGLLGDGFKTQFAPLNNAASIYSPFSGMGSTTTTQQQGGGAMGALGGAIGAAQFGRNMGWWGS